MKKGQAGETMKDFWKDYGKLRMDLTDVRALMKESVRTKEKALETPLAEMIDSGGKLLRPAFVLVASRFGEKEPGNIKELAAIVELLHMGTLIHDDIIDEAVLRRGSPSVQSKYGKDYAVYLGDYLFTRCFLMLSRRQDMENMRNLSEVISRICMGEIMQYDRRYDRELTVKKYLKIISGKTAALFALSFAVGAKESGADKRVLGHLAHLGYNIGMAFQIMDDILDYNGETRNTGKGPAADIKKGYLNLPMIYALANPESGELRALLEKSEPVPDEEEAVVKWVDDLGGHRESPPLVRNLQSEGF